jgi:hypothetical protein
MKINKNCIFFELFEAIKEEEEKFVMIFFLISLFGQS